MDPRTIYQQVAQCAIPIPSDPSHLRQKFDQILGKCLSEETQVVMLGGSTHGTEEFYRLRSEITKELISKHGFSIVAVEADWPDAYRVNRYVRTNFKSRDKDPGRALGDFQSFPQWMWRNTVMTDFVSWLQKHNRSQKWKDNECGFYGLDIYSMNRSRNEVVKYLQNVNPELANRAKRFYGCFDRFSNDPDTYSYKIGLGLESDCENSVLKVLNDMMSHQAEIMSQDDIPEDDTYFYAKTNARVVANAESYFRNMIRRDNSCNIRDRSMLETLVDLIMYLSEKAGVRKKAVVWAHSSHLGDSAFTSGAKFHEVNLGQLIRSSFGLNKCFSVGLTTYCGSVTAAAQCDGEPDYFILNEGMPGSIEHLFHETVAEINWNEPDKDFQAFMIVFRSPNPKCDIVAPQEVSQILGEPRIQRAIGVVYMPGTERLSHYQECKLSFQFDSVIHIDRTNAVTPLELAPIWIAKTEVVVFTPIDQVREEIEQSGDAMGMDVS